MNADPTDFMKKTNDVSRQKEKEEFSTKFISAIGVNNEVMIVPLPAEYIFIEMFKALDEHSVG